MESGRWAEGGPGRVQRLGKQDVHKVVPCLVSAFWDFPEVVHLLPGETSRRRVLPRYLLSDAADAAGFLTLEAVVVGSEVAGAAAWVPPGGYLVSLARQVKEAIRLAPILPWGLSALREARRGQEANRQRHRGYPAHFWLRAIGVAPGRQGSGIGGLLMRSMLARADAEGVGCFLFTATEENSRWYQGFGFEIKDSYHPTSSWPRVWAMWRDPR